MAGKAVKFHFWGLRGVQVTVSGRQTAAPQSLVITDQFQAGSMAMTPGLPLIMLRLFPAEQ